MTVGVQTWGDLINNPIVIAVNRTTYVLQAKFVKLFPANDGAPAERLVSASIDGCT